MNRQQNENELRNNVLDFLQENIDGTLATVKNNIPRSSPVRYFLGENFEIYVLSAGGEKFDAIRENPNVCLLVNSDYLDYRRIKGVQIFGTATTSLMDSTIFDEAVGYSHDPHMMMREKHSLKVIKIVPEEIVYLDALKDGDRTKHVLKGNVEINEELLFSTDDQNFIPSFD